MGIRFTASVPVIEAEGDAVFAPTCGKAWQVSQAMKGAWHHELSPGWDLSQALIVRRRYDAKMHGNACSPSDEGVA